MNEIITGPEILSIDPTSIVLKFDFDQICKDKNDFEEKYPSITVPDSVVRVKMPKECRIYGMKLIWETDDENNSAKS